MNQQEYEALESEYLPHEARTLYVMCIRRYMDFKTGLTGVVRKVSHQMFIEQLEVRRPRGSKLPDYVPTKQAVRELIKKLEEAGLIEKLPQTHMRDPMVFRCLLAHTDLIRPDEEQHRNNTTGTTQAATQENPVFTRFACINTNTSNNAGTTQEEQHTSVTSVTTTTLAQQNAFAMRLDWKPSECFGDRLKSVGIQPQRLTEDQWKQVLGEFVSYWTTQPGRQHRQAEWEHRLLQQVQKNVRGGNRHDNFSASTGQHRTSQPGRSAVAAALGDIDHDFTAD